MKSQHSNNQNILDKNQKEANIQSHIEQLQRNNNTLRMLLGDLGNQIPIPPPPSSYQNKHIIIRLNTNDVTSVNCRNDCKIERLISCFETNNPTINLNEPRITYMGKELSLDKTHQDYSIPDGTTLYLVSKEHEEENTIIYVKIDSKTFIPFNVCPNYHVETVIKPLREKHGIDIKKLVYNGRTLKKEEEFHSFLLPNQYTLTAIPNE